MTRRGLDATDRKLLSLKLGPCRLKVVDLCKLVGLQRTAVSTRINRPAFKRALREAWHKAFERLIEQRLARHEAPRRR